MGCGGAFDGVEHLLDVQAVGEGRRGLRAGRDGRDEVVDLVDEAVLPADGVAGGPPGGVVGSVRFGGEDPAEAGLDGRAGWLS